MRLTLFFFFVLHISLAAQNITWSSDIANIVYSKCTNCHRTGGIAPFTLESYSEVISRQSSIDRVIKNGVMPPWPPDASYSRFAHERSLSNNQKETILNWLDNGTPRGDLNKEPPLPIYPNNGDLSGVPDLILNAPVFKINAQNDIYQCFVVKNPNSIDKFIQAMEVIPGNRNAVHHVLVYYDKTGQAKKLDDASTEPGYISFGGIGVSSAELIGAWVPGSAPQTYPKGMGVKIPANGDIVMQIHYPRSADGQMDQTLLRIFFSNVPNTRQVFISPILNHDISLVNGPLIIPANTVKTFTSEFTINALKFTLLSVAPHMHLIGKSIEVFAEEPVNKYKIPLIKINDWDFHWQGSYSFQKPIILLPDTKLTAYATYDNTSNNPNNPNSPPKIVFLGEKTTDEMMLVYFSFLLYQQGDEKIIIDSSALNSVKDIQPAEDKELMVIKNGTELLITLEDKWNNGYLTLYNSEGKVFYHNKIVNENQQINICNVSPGLIFIQANKPDQTIYKKYLLQD